jgi:putative FmdB family regulatory protein
MPIYEFECDNTEGCESNLRYEKEIPLALPHVYDCPICGSPMRKIYSSVPVHFKAGGFYSTDSK